MNTKQFWNALEMILQNDWLYWREKKKGLYMEGAVLLTELEIASYVQMC